MAELTPEEWLVEIENGKEYRRIFGKEEAWTNIEKAYLNDPDSYTAIGPNLIYSMGDALLSALIVPDPEFLIKPLRQESVEPARIVEAQANVFTKTLGLKEQVETSLLHCYLFGRGFIKIGYDSEFGWNPFLDIGGPQFPQGASMTQFDRQGYRIESGIANPGNPWVRAVDPHDIVVPWGVIDIEHAPWVAHRVIRLNKSIKADPKYKNKSNLEPTMNMEEFMDSYNHSSIKRRLYKNPAQHMHNSKEAYNVLWEIHDRRTGKVLVVSPDYDKFLRKDPDALQAIGTPFVSASFIRHPRAFWATPQAYYLGQIQATQFDIARQAEKQRRVNVLKFLVDENSISDDELNKALGGDVGAFAKVSTTRPLKDIIQTFPQGNNLDLMMHADWNRRDARDAVGMSRNQLGEFDQSSRRTASEAGIVQQGAQNRQARRADVMTIFYSRTIKKVMALVERFWTKQRSVQVQDNWMFFTGDMLKGEYDYDLSLSTKRHISMFDRKLEALQLLANLAIYPGANLPAIEQYVAQVANDPQFANFFLSTAQQQGIGQAPSSITSQQQQSLGTGQTLGGGGGNV